MEKIGRSGSAWGQAADEVVRRWVGLGASAAVAVALGYTWLEYPGPARTAVLVCSGAALVGLLTRRLPILSSLLYAVGGGVAVAMTSRELFSFWLAGAGLLFLAALPSFVGRRQDGLRMSIAAVAGLIGVSWAAATDQTREALTAAFPVLVAAMAVVLLRTLFPLLGKVVRLRDEAEVMRRLASEAEADNRELERRAELARELHDSLGHHVTAMVVQAEAGQVGAPGAALESIGDLGREALAELENVLFELRSGPPGFDLRSIDSKLAQPLRDAEVLVTVEIGATVEDPLLQRTVYRIVQEALTNVMRHAAAHEVRVQVADLGGDVVVRVADDGVGLPADVVRGAGLAGIAARAQEHGGQVRLLDVEPHGLLIEVLMRRAAS